MQNHKPENLYHQHELEPQDEVFLRTEGFTRHTTHGSYGVEEHHWIDETHYYTPVCGERYNCMHGGLYLRAKTPEAKAYIGADLCDEIVPQD